MSVDKPEKQHRNVRSLSSPELASDLTESIGESRTLIICIHRDNDIGERAGVKTPVFGRDACLAAAQKLALADPEEADANAIFAAVKEYDGLLKKGFSCEVVVISGLFERGVLGDKKI